MIKDYNANSTNGGGGVVITNANARVSNAPEEDDEEDPRTPTSMSSQGSQGYDSAGSDFIDIEGFQQIPDSSLHELSLQVKKKIELPPSKLASQSKKLSKSSDPQSLGIPCILPRKFKHHYGLHGPGEMMFTAVGVSYANDVDFNKRSPNVAKAIIVEKEQKGNPKVPLSSKPKGSRASSKSS